MTTSSTTTVIEERDDATDALVALFRATERVECVTRDSLTRSNWFLIGNHLLSKFVPRYVGRMDGLRTNVYAIIEDIKRLENSEAIGEEPRGDFGFISAQVLRAYDALRYVSHRDPLGFAQGQMYEATLRLGKAKHLIQERIPNNVVLPTHQPCGCGHI